MRISSKGDYGLALMVGLAKQPRLASTSLRQIAKAEQVPYAYAEQIAARLKHAKLIVSHRGSQGGYRLERPPSKISVGEIIRALDEDKLLPCQKSDHQCPRQGQCSTHDVWSTIQLSLYKTMDKISLHDLLLNKQ